MKTVRSRDREFRELLTCLERRGRRDASAVEEPVAEILREVQLRGDAAVAEYTERFDRVALTPDQFPVGRKQVQQAYRKVPRDLLALFEESAQRIRGFHERQRTSSWFESSEDGTLLGQLVTPIDRVGLYVPGGKAAYPSSVLMNAIPAQVAGVRSLAMCTPAPGGVLNPHVLVVADLLGLEEIYRIGGAQAVGALAFGTETIPRVDKIVGPGNIYVALAKRRVFGEVGIDMMAGPSEVVVVADDSADPEWLAADLLAQAEHDPMARAVLVTDAPDLAPRVARALAAQLGRLARKDIAAEALQAHGALVLVGSLEEAAELANLLAPEHLELLVRVPQALLPRVRHAGAIFVGGRTPEVVGDYVAGPSHVLPTAGTARFSSPLGVEDFVKRSSVIEYSGAGLQAALPHLRTLADIEGLGGHRRAADVRAGGEGR